MHIKFVEVELAVEFPKVSCNKYDDAIKNRWEVTTMKSQLNYHNDYNKYQNCLRYHNKK